MAVKAEPHDRFRGIYWVVLEDGSRGLATINLSPGRSVYGERLIEYEDKEYRMWDPFRSKLAAAILKGLSRVQIRPGDKVLYLGAATGTTASHVSDIVDVEGHVYCIEFAPRVLRKLVCNVCDFRKNTSPVLADARFPERYRMFVETIDEIYCDIAQPEQARVLADSADMFLKTGGWVTWAIKARSVDVTKAPSEIYRREVETLLARGFDVKEVVRLEPYDRDHAMVVAEFFGEK